MFGLAPHTDALFWGQQHFPISFSNRVMQKELLKWESSIVDTVFLSNNIQFVFHECYKTFWNVTIRDSQTQKTFEQLHPNIWGNRSMQISFDLILLISFLSFASFHSLNMFGIMIHIDWTAYVVTKIKKNLTNNVGCDIQKETSFRIWYQYISCNNVK